MGFVTNVSGDRQVFFVEFFLLEVYVLLVLPSAK